ncbi:MAG: thioredoxin domain-containing protein [Bacteroidetes bacterium]|nr:thioredoxin domain-containing protein [Bacteroidota bacterium]
MKTPRYTNALIHESSPYLLQHAHNPVNWYPWNEDVLARAQQEDKLILVSIGYSACHWCHVMEHESFESEQVAELMNKHFINIKIDREERPDIDMVYMSAVQLMTGQGGWPLNCFLLPDGRPVYGGTYFQKAQWMEILQSLADVYKNDKPRTLEYAAKLTGGMLQSELIEKPKEEMLWDEETLHHCVRQWKPRMDAADGGPARAPKFPLPNNYLFLLRYAHQYHDEILMNHVHVTLSKMARGGIYDQLGGGFARYSTDMQWKVPHFEKMLYDNAQLVSLYCEAYKQSHNNLYKEVVEQTLAFVERELCSPETAFYSALDADSEGVEGKYYVWQKEELEDLLQDDFPVFADYYSVNDTGYWEHENYILMRCENENEVALSHDMSIESLRRKMQHCRERLLTERNKRVRPELDDKTLTSWNALMCKAFADAYLVFGNTHYRDIALRNAAFLRKNVVQPDGSLYHAWKNGKATIQGFLEDYAFMTDTWLMLYVITHDEQWLQEARKWTDYSIEHFYDEKSGLFYFTGNTGQSLVVRKKELSDNVIPASNSQTALNLFRLAVHTYEKSYFDMAANMLATQAAEIKNYGSGYSNWALLMLDMTGPHYELAIVGKSVNEKLLELGRHYLPNVIFALSETASEWPLLRNRFVDGETLIYVCKNNTCMLPVKDVPDALKQMS